MSQIYIEGPCAPRRPPSGKILTRAQVLAYIYIIIVNFQLRSSIHAGLTEHSLYNRFALKNLPKCGIWGILGGGAKIFCGNPLGMQCPPIYVLWCKNYGDKKKVKERIVLREIHLRTTGLHLSMGSHSVISYPTEVTAPPSPQPGRCSKYPSLYTRQRNLKKKTKKRNVYAVRVTFHPCAVLTP